MNGIIETLKALEGMTTFIKLLSLAELTDQLNSEGPFTVFAPNDEAFQELPPETYREMSANLESLKDVLSYHIVPGEYTNEELLANPSLATLQGEDLLIDVFDDTLEVNDAAIITPDVSYNNGWIHVIDAVLMP